MIETTAEYQAQVTAPVTMWKPKLKIDYTDYNLDNSITTIVTDRDRTSDDAQMADGIESPTYRWQSWTNFEWGKYKRSETPTNNEKGALSNRLSDADNNFNLRAASTFGHYCFGHKTFAPPVDYPKFSVTFSARTVNSIKVVFDDKLNEWAEDFDVNIYIGGTIDTTEVVTGNTTVRYTKTLSSPVILATEVEVVIKKWSIPGTKAKIMESFTSIQETYEGGDLFFLDVHEEAEPQKATIPIGNMTANSLNAGILNLNNKFDNDNPSSVLAGNVIKNRRLTSSVQLNDVDEIPTGVFYSTNWNIKNENLEAEVSGQDIVNLMGEQKYDKSQFIIPGSPQNFVYTTTADFNLFVLDNVEVGTNQILFAGAAVVCGESPRYTFGQYPFGNKIFQSVTYCGTADKTISFSYTPGTTITGAVSYNGTTPAGSRIRWFYSYTAVDNFIEFQLSDGYVYTPVDISNTTQTIKIRALMEVPAVEVIPEIDDITVNLTEKVTLLSLARLVIEDFDNNTGLIEGNFSIDEAFGEIELETAYLSPQSHREALKLICEAGAGRAFSSRTGTLTIETLKAVSTPVETWTDADFYEKSKPVNDNQLYNRVTVITNPLEKAASAEVVATTKIDIADTEVQTITVEYKKEPVGDITLSGLPAGVTATDTTYYTWGAVIELTNASGGDEDFTLTINGKPYEITGSRFFEYDDTDSIRRNGIIEYPVNNPLVQTEEQAIDIGNRMIASFGNQRREISLDVLADPSLEIGDTFDENGNFYIVNGQDIDIKKGSLIHVVEGKR